MLRNARKFLSILRGRPAAAGKSSDAAASLAGVEAQRVARIAARAFAGGPDGPEEDVETGGPVYIGLRTAGKRLWAGWLDRRTLAEVFSGALAESGVDGAVVDAIEICSCHDERPVPVNRFDNAFPGSRRGLDGMTIRHGGSVRRFAPTEAIATNRGFARQFEVTLADRKVGQDEFFETGGEILKFLSRRLLVFLSEEGARAVELHRGNRVVDPGSVGPETVAAMIAAMGAWMARNCGDDGRMTYKYWPSRGEYSKANNTIRQFMASVCLAEIARREGTAEAARRVRRNLSHNLDRFLRVADGVGSIEYDGSAKLGAAALAGLAILKLADRSEFAEPFDALVRGVAALWCQDGSFRTFHKPADRNDNQNFYPGEALLFWAELYGATGDPELLDRILRSVAWYRDWHRDNPNPAFVPWHSQACVRLFELTGGAGLADHVFAMNDWLLSMQQWEDAPSPDLMGRFYDPKRPQFGPPHASSTGAYLEGLAAACRLAERVGDEARLDTYGRAIWRGIRSLRQLQFLDEVDCFYISKRSRVMGGLRTETYDNEIRVDNVQHGLMALLALDALGPRFRSLGS